MNNEGDAMKPSEKLELLAGVLKGIYALESTLPSRTTDEAMIDVFNAAGTAKANLRMLETDETIRRSATELPGVSIATVLERLIRLERSCDTRATEALDRIGKIEQRNVRLDEENVKVRAEEAAEKEEVQEFNGAVDDRWARVDRRLKKLNRRIKTGLAGVNEALGFAAADIDMLRERVSKLEPTEEDDVSIDVLGKMVKDLTNRTMGVESRLGKLNVVVEDRGALILQSFSEQKDRLLKGEERAGKNAAAIVHESKRLCGINERLLEDVDKLGNRVDDVDMKAARNQHRIDREAQRLSITGDSMQEGFRRLNKQLTNYAGDATVVLESPPWAGPGESIGITGNSTDPAGTVTLGTAVGKTVDGRPAVDHEFEDWWRDRHGVKDATKKHYANSGWNGYKRREAKGKQPGTTEPGEIDDETWAELIRGAGFSSSRKMIQGCDHDWRMSLRQGILRCDHCSAMALPSMAKRLDELASERRLDEIGLGDV